MDLTSAPRSRIRLYQFGGNRIFDISKKIAQRIQNMFSYTFPIEPLIEPKITPKLNLYARKQLVNGQESPELFRLSRIRNVFQPNNLPPPPSPPPPAAKQNTTPPITRQQNTKQLNNKQLNTKH